MTLLRPYATALAALFVVACQGGGTGEWAGTVADSAGVQIVSNPAEGVWSDGYGWTVEEELRVGALQGDADYQFGQIAPGGITIDSQGRIYVLDGQAQEIKVYSADGIYERTIGARGGGPGELLGAQFLVMGPGDTLVVPDLGNLRINLFTPDGENLGSFPIAMEKGLPMVFNSTPSGMVAQQIRHLDLPNLPTTPDSMDAIEVIALDGTVVDTLKTFPAGRSFSFSGGRPEFNVYSAEPVWELLDDGSLAYGVNDDYRIGIYGADGQLERVITKPFERQPVSDADKQAVLGFFERAVAAQGAPPEAMEMLRNAVHFGEFFPAFAALIAGPDGSIWVQHIQTASGLSEEELEGYNLLEDAGAPDWDVFDSEGRFLGQVSMPPRFAPRFFRGDDIYGVWRDDLDVQYVVRMKVNMPKVQASS